MMPTPYLPSCCHFIYTNGRKYNLTWDIYDPQVLLVFLYLFFSFVPDNESFFLLFYTSFWRWQRENCMKKGRMLEVPVCPILNLLKIKFVHLFVRSFKVGWQQMFPEIYLHCCNVFLSDVVDAHLCGPVIILCICLLKVMCLHSLSIAHCLCGLCSFFFFVFHGIKFW